MHIINYLIMLISLNLYSWFQLNNEYVINKKYMANSKWRNLVQIPQADRHYIKVSLDQNKGRLHIYIWLEPWLGERRDAEGLLAWTTPPPLSEEGERGCRKLQRNVWGYHVILINKEKHKKVVTSNWTWDFENFNFPFLFWKLQIENGILSQFSIFDFPK